MVEPEDDTDATIGDIETDDDKIMINVGGLCHETLVSSLVNKPGTRLSILAKRHAKGRKEEYFFDRHPGVFSTVMDYYRSGELHVPLDVCGAVVKRELDYWQIDDTQIEACCWTSYSQYIDNQKTLSDFNQSVETESDQIQALDTLHGWRRTQMRIWMVLDHPRSSKIALVYAVTSFLFVCASITGFCLETLSIKNTTVNVTGECIPGEPMKRIAQSHWLLEVLDYVCTAFFTVELLVRVTFAPNKLIFFKSLMNIIDIAALLPLYVQISLDLADEQICLKNNTAVLETIFILRIIRIFRIFHLVKHYKALKILVHAIRASIQELLMLSIFLFIAMLVFSTLIFYAERGGPDGFGGGDFQTIPIGFWWSIITMTTVGYGDVFPKTPLGYCIGGLCALWGVLLIALTIPVISNNFALFYMHARTREAIAKKKTMSRKQKEESGHIKDKPPNEMVSKKGADTKALLNRMDSNSTTDESTVMLAARFTDNRAAGSCGKGNKDTSEPIEDTVV